MENEDSLRARGAVLASAIRMLDGMPVTAKKRQYADLRRRAVMGIVAEAERFRDPHTVVVQQAMAVKEDFEHLLTGALAGEATKGAQIELASLAVKAAAEGHWASFRGLEALLQVRPMPFAEGDKLAEMISIAYEALAQAQDFAPAGR
mgnify:FL=1